MMRTMEKTPEYEEEYYSKVHGIHSENTALR